MVVYLAAALTAGFYLFHLPVRGAAENDGWVELVDDGMRHEAVYPLKR